MDDVFDVGGWRDWQHRRIEGFLNIIIVAISYPGKDLAIMVMIPRAIEKDEQVW